MIQLAISERHSSERALSRSLVAAVAASMLILAAPAGSKAASAESEAAPPIAAPLAEQGAELAGMWCNACHVTGTGQPQSGMDAAPPFASLAPMVAADPDKYRTFLTKPHGPMREITLSRQEIDAVIAYIVSLNTGQ